jgi:hypothetical protein
MGVSLLVPSSSPSSSQRKGAVPSGRGDRMTKPTAKAKGTATVDVGENEVAIIEKRRGAGGGAGGPGWSSPAPDAHRHSPGRRGARGRARRPAHHLDRFLAALKKRRLEIRKSDLERKLEPHLEARQVAGEKLEALEEQRVALTEEIGKVAQRGRQGQGVVVAKAGTCRDVAQSKRRKGHRRWHGKRGAGGSTTIRASATTMAG